jgi:hypothetical protein
VDRGVFSKLHVHGGKIDWVQYLNEDANHKKVQDLRREWREVHWRARHPDAGEEPPTHKWYTPRVTDAAGLRASPPELNGDECDELNLRRRRPRQRVACTSTTTAARAGTKRKRGACPPTSPKSSNTRPNGALASSASAASAGSSSSRGEKDLSDPESTSIQEATAQGRNKRRRFD